MKRYFFLIIISLICLISTSYSDVQWEDCTEGLEGINIRDVFIIDNEFELYCGNNPFSYSSNDSGKSWKPRKYIPPSLNRETYYPIASIYKYKNRYIMSKLDYRVDYISEDKKTLYG
ncbi:MAG TPA: hypothetical protein P5545_05795, partial [Bacteroidota bacterium]|nr:hypothetical protein [Bacteroidota bacterium]